MNSGDAFAACPGCDLLVKIPALSADQYLSCGRCGTTIRKSYTNSIDRVLALSAAGLMLYLPAMLLPLLTLSSLGINEKSNVIETAINFFLKNYPFVALMVLITAVIVPFLKLFLPFIVSLYLKTAKRPLWLKPALKIMKHLEEWGMVEVYLLGILITLIKVGDLASISFDTGFFCFVALVFISITTTIFLDYNLFWVKIDNDNSQLSKEHFKAVSKGLDQAPQSPITAASAGMIRCHDCGLLVRSESAGTDHSPPDCPRCRSALHLRKPGSLNRTWALVISSLILYVPANVLPIMRVDFLGIPERSTIMDGIIYFFKEGSYGIGVIILTASILVPLFKITGMLINLITIHRGKNRFLKQKAKMFRFIEFIGRWSMLDVFVISLLSVLVNFGFLTSIHSAPAATYFCMVVVLTMSAAIVFDPRIMWDECDPIEQTIEQQQGLYGRTTEH